MTETLAGDKLEARTYEIKHSFKRLLKAATWICLVVGILFLSFPLWPDEDNSNNSTAILIISLLAITFFSYLGWTSHGILKGLPFCSVTVDQDGIWPTHLQKETALVRWQEIHATKEQPRLQRLDLLDSASAVVLKLEYQLDDFMSLRLLLLERMRTPAMNIPVTFKKQPFYHAITIVLLIAIFVAGLYAVNSNEASGYLSAGALIAIIAHEYLTTVDGIVIDHEKLVFRYPLRTVELGRDKPFDILLGDFMNRGMAHPTASILMEGQKKPIDLRYLGIDSFTLFQLLREWKSGR